MPHIKYTCYVLLLTTRCLAEDNTFPPYFFEPLEKWPNNTLNISDPFDFLKVLNLPDYRNPVTLEDFLIFHNVVPHMMEFVPNETLEVTYEDIKVKTGWAFAPLLMKNMPRLNWKADPNSLYLLVFTDPDFPSTSTAHCGELMHWFVSNIPGLQIEKGDTYIEYLGPVPLEKSGLHRYVYQIYKQQRKMIFPYPHVNARQIHYRRCFRSMEFSTKYKLGNPVATNIFLADYDGHTFPITKLLGNHFYGPGDNFDEPMWT